MKKKLLTLGLVTFSLVAFTLCKQLPPKVMFMNLKNGDKIQSPVKIDMGVENFKVVPAGAIKKGEGHHHLLIDKDPIPKGVVIPADAESLHFGAGQVSAMIELPAGKHRLTLQLGDGVHQSYGPEASSTIEVEIEAPAVDPNAPKDNANAPAPANAKVDSKAKK